MQLVCHGEKPWRCSTALTGLPGQY
jgi:hypothetical protein